jgi:hypothetical protein
MSPERPHAQRVPRRTALKRIGAGAAVAWSVPVLSSVRTSAFAQSGGFPCDICDPGQPCGVLDPCGPGDVCACFVLIDFSACRCDEFPSNVCSDYPPCDSHDDCPSGMLCYATCCPTGICRGPCTGSSRAPKRAGSGPKVTP